MVKNINQQNKKIRGISLEKLTDLVGGISKGISNLLKSAIRLEKQGKSEYIDQGEITGKTRSGKEIKGSYGFGIKIGLDKILMSRKNDKK